MSSRFAPALARAVEKRRRAGVDEGEISNLVLSGAASLRGIERLTGLESLSVDQPGCLRAIAGHPRLACLDVACRWRFPSFDAELVSRLPALRELQLLGVWVDDLRPLSDSALAQLRITYCEVRRQRFRPPASLVELDIDGTEGLELFGVCPELRVVDLWGTNTRPLEWVAQQPAIEELWLNGCEVATLAPMLAMPRPPRWVFMDGDEQGDLDRHRANITALEARGAHFALGWPHDIGIWIPSWDKVTAHEREPLYLSPGWPRSRILPT